MAAIAIVLFYLFWRKQWILMKNNISYSGNLSHDTKRSDEKSI